MGAKEIVAALGGRWCGNYGLSPCPTHDDRRPSLKVRDDPGKSDGLGGNRSIPRGLLLGIWTEVRLGVF